MNNGAGDVHANRYLSISNVNLLELLKLARMILYDIQSGLKFNSIRSISPHSTTDNRDVFDDVNQKKKKISGRFKIRSDYSVCVTIVASGPKYSCKLIRLKFPFKSKCGIRTPLNF